MGYLKKSHPIAKRRQRKKGAYHLRATNGVLPSQYILPVGYVLRDLLRVSRNLKETKKYLLKNDITVGGKKIKDIRYPIRRG